ncbi:hypothetical protein ACFYZ4_13550 [Streptomyces sp. NPDC001513]|uniref:hypothetical protein n=1 Tax=Streptomyces sp. NPDC001513 TaxID=3364580 RepID=UPI0036ACA9AA
MARDQLWARQGNVRNPYKAAADGVWRDLRQVLSYAVDHGGLTAASQRHFLQRYVRHHNRLANGAAPEIMARMAALIDCGLLDVGARSFLLSALRPNADHYVMRDTLVWLDRFWPRTTAR